tara:strand:+ start:92 stop:445 length:354 start_codon:yes stop_codon:yes gene_type:complete
MANLIASVKELSSLSILKLQGKLNDSEAKSIIDIVNNLLDKNLINVIMNFENCTEVNNYGISILISLIGAVNEKNGKIVFTNIDSNLEKKFKMMGLSSYVEFYNDDEVALKKINMQD